MEHISNEGFHFFHKPPQTVLQSKRQWHPRHFLKGLKQQQKKLFKGTSRFISLWQDLSFLTLILSILAFLKDMFFLPTQTNSGTRPLTESKRPLLFLFQFNIFI